MNEGSTPQSSVVRDLSATVSRAPVGGSEGSSFQQAPVRGRPALTSPQLEPQRLVDKLTLEAARLRRRIEWMDERVAALEQNLTETEAQRAAAIQELHTLRTSTLWQVLYPLRVMSGKLPPRVRRSLRRVLKLMWWTLSFQLINKLTRRRAAQHEEAESKGVIPAPEVDPQSSEIDNYVTWIAWYDTITDDDRQAIGVAIDNMLNRPTISVVMPVYESPEVYLQAAIESVRAQLYPNWELCIADDASPSPHVRAALERYRKADPRIKLLYRTENGHISAASNDALALATGEYVAMLDHDGVLPEHALYVVAAMIAEDPKLDLLYSDEDKLDSEGKRFDPYFKSDWNPDLLLGQNMFSHLGVYRRSLIEEIGGFRQGYEGSQDHDLILRASARTMPERIKHLPYILYHWRAVPNSTLSHAHNKDYALENARRAIDDYLSNQGIEATVEPSRFPDFHRIRYSISEPRPMVSLIVPIGASLDLVRTCLSGLLDSTDYQPLEVLIIVNVGTRPEVLLHLNELSKGDLRIIIVVDDHPDFNFSRICNLGVARARGEVIGLVNDDVEVIEPGWLEEMVSQALRPGVGAVGALLHYPDERIQHAGVVVGLGGVAGHAHSGRPRSDHGYFGRAALTQNVSAVTGACLVMRKAFFGEVGGLDEVNLAIAFNDIDLCLRIREKGYQIVWTPFAELYHHESASRGNDFAPDKIKRFRAECAFMEQSWGEVLRHDPYYSPNHSFELPGFGLAFPPRIQKPW